MQNPSSAPHRKRSPGLAHDIVTALTQQILLGQMAPGEKLPSESAIVGEYGVSRTVVREALSKLQAAGLVETRHGVGTDEQLQQMRQALDDYQDSLANNDSAVEPDVRFHRLIAQATGNTYFTDVIYHLGNSVIPRTRINAEERGDADLMALGRLANLEHEAILKAIRRQDPDAARAAMLLHLSNSLERMTGE